MCLFRDFPWMGNNGFAMMIGWTIICLYLFTINFLSLKESNPKIYRVMFFIPVLGVLIIILSFFASYLTTVKFFIGSVVVSIPTILVVGFYRTTEYRPARYFILAFSFALLGIMIISLEVLKILPSSFLTKNAFIIGNSFEMILLSMGLADRFNFIQEISLIREEEAKSFRRTMPRLSKRKLPKKPTSLKLKKMNIEHIMEITYEQKRSRDQLLGNLSQGYLTFNNQGIIHLGALKLPKSFL